VKKMLICALLVGCDDVPQPFDLDHARVMAVQIDPPSIAAGERASIHVLVTDATSGPRVADPTALDMTAPGGIVVERGDTGWSVLAPDVAIEAIIPLAITVETDEGTLSAQKTLALGTRAENPSVPEILLDGDARALEVPPDRESILSVAEPQEGLSYRWFSSVGDLTGYTRSEVRLEPIDDARGFVVLVARDQMGGTSWTIATAAVTR
jgi:hypothetical protein